MAKLTPFVEYYGLSLIYTSLYMVGNRHISAQSGGKWAHIF
jgi:hypothetical protein